MLTLDIPHNDKLIAKGKLHEAATALAAFVGLPVNEVWHALYNNASAIHPPCYNPTCWDGDTYTPSKG